MRYGDGDGGGGGGDVFPTAPRADRAFWIALAVLVAVLPVGGTVALRSLALLALFCIAGWALAANRLRLHQPLLAPWLAYAGVALASLAYAIDPAYSLSEIRVEILFPALLFWIAASCLRSETALQRLLALLALVATFLVLYCLTTAAIGETTKDGLIGTLYTGVGNFSTYLVTVMPLLAAFGWFRWQQRRHADAWALLLLLALCNGAMYVTLNRQGFIAMALEVAVLAGCLLLRGINRRTLATAGAAGVLLLVLGGLFVTQFERHGETSDVVQEVRIDPRWAMWRFAGERIAARPWSGGGFGLQSFRLAYPEFEPGTRHWHAHNMVLNKGIQMGLPGIAAFLLLLAALPLHLWRGLRRQQNTAAIAITGLAMVAGVYLKNMTDDFFLRGDGMLFWLLAGAIAGVIRGGDDRNGPLKILVIRRDNIGDLVCTTPALRALRQHFPAARIEVLVNDYNAPALAGLPGIDAVHAYRKGKHRLAGEPRWSPYVARIGLLWRLRRRRFDWTIIAGAHFSPYALRLARLVGAQRTVGYLPPGVTRVTGLGDGIVHDGQLCHEVEDVFRLLGPLGIAGTPGPLLVVAERSLQERFAGQLQDAGRRPGRPLLAVHISAREAERRWPAERFIALLDRLTADSRCEVMLLWAPGAAEDALHPGDDALAAHILAALAARPVYPLPTRQLAELIAALALCDLAIASDGGAMHLAAALGKPVLAFFENAEGKTRHWYPWQVPHQLLISPTFAVADISLDAALAGFDRLMAECQEKTGALRRPKYHAYHAEEDQ